jgi:hypothetical protein
MGERQEEGFEGEQVVGHIQMRPRRTAHYGALSSKHQKWFFSCITSQIPTTQKLTWGYMGMCAVCAVRRGFGEGGGA